MVDVIKSLSKRADMMSFKRLTRSLRDENSTKESEYRRKGHLQLRTVDA
jgi:hypothetical protein